MWTPGICITRGLLVAVQFDGHPARQVAVNAVLAARPVRPAVVGSWTATEISIHSTYASIASSTQRRSVVVFMRERCRSLRKIASVGPLAGALGRPESRGARSQAHPRSLGA